MPFSQKSTTQPILVYNHDGKKPSEFSFRFSDATSLPPNGSQRTKKTKKRGQFFSTIATIDLKNHSTLEVKVKALCLHSCSGLLLPNAPLREPTLKSAHRRGRENHQQQKWFQLLVVQNTISNQWWNCRKATVFVYSYSYFFAIGKENGASTPAVLSLLETLKVGSWSQMSSPIRYLSRLD